MKKQKMITVILALFVSGLIGLNFLLTSNDELTLERIIKLNEVEAMAMDEGNVILASLQDVICDDYSSSAKSCEYDPFGSCDDTQETECEGDTGNGNPGSSDECEEYGHNMSQTGSQMSCIRCSFSYESQDKCTNNNNHNWNRENTPRYCLDCGKQQR